MSDRAATPDIETALMDAIAHSREERARRLAHDLKTPLNGIIGFAQLMHNGKTGPLSAQQLEFLSDILTSARQLCDLISEHLEEPRPDAAGTAGRPTDRPGAPLPRRMSSPA
jgi:signal transduction histidine kinase